MEIKINDYWNPQLHTLLIFNYTSPILLFTIKVQDWWGHFYTELFLWCVPLLLSERYITTVGKGTPWGRQRFVHYEWSNYFQTEVKVDSRFLRNKNPDKYVTFYVFLSRWECLKKKISNDQDF